MPAQAESRTDADIAPLAADLRIAVGELIRRLRAENLFPLNQTWVLGRLDREGPASVSDLAQAMRVRPQSMAQTVGDLEAEGMVERNPDPDDRRRALVSLTAAGPRADRSRPRAPARAGWSRRWKSSPRPIARRSSARSRSSPASPTPTSETTFPPVQ